MEIEYTTLYDELEDDQQADFDNLKNMVHFFKEHGLIPEETELKLSETGTQCFPVTGIIHIDFEQMDATSEKLLLLTCNNDMEFMENFWNSEIILCHELGHLVDFVNRMKSDVPMLRRELTTRMAVEHARNKIMAETLRRLCDKEVEDVEDEIENLEDITYRSLPLEIEADKIGYELLKYCLQHH